MNCKFTRKELEQKAKTKLIDLLLNNQIDKEVLANQNINFNNQINNLNQEVGKYQLAFQKAEMRRNALEYAITLMHQSAVLGLLAKNNNMELKLHLNDKVQYEPKINDDLKLAV